jgi:hypothetical protein
VGASHLKAVQDISGKQGVAEGTGQQLNIQQLATVSDEALDNAYHYGRSTPGNSFGWQANLKSAAYAKHMIDKGVTDIEAISDAIHKGWNVTAQAFVQNPAQFSDTEKLKAAGKLESKLQQRAELMKQNYAQLPEEEKEKDRVVARALLQAVRGEQGVAEGIETINGSKYSVDPDKYYVWAWDGAAVLYGEYDNINDAKINLPKIEQRAIERLGPYAKDAFELSTGKDLLQRYGKKEINELKDETIHSYLSKADRQISNRQNRMSQARERLNKNYEIYDVNNPTKIIDKFEANTPELARRYFEKFIKEYNPGDQNFEFEVRRSTGLSEDYLPEK